MTHPALFVKKGLLLNCLSWFQVDFRQSIVALIESQFPNYPLPSEVQSVLERWDSIRRPIDADPMDLAALMEDQLASDPGAAPLLKQMILRYRRYRAAETEGLREKTHNANIIQTLDEDINSLDAVVEADWFEKIELLRLPRSNDFLPIQYIEQSGLSQIELGPRQYDEKFHILQSPALFLPDLAYFRAKCEMRESPLSVAFLDIDDFKVLNSTTSETHMDRNLLPRFMQTLEAHVYHHGFAYRQGGDEYLILLPSLSQPLVLAFLEELRCKLAALKYPEIEGSTTVSIGVCSAQPNCSLTDRELRDRANDAKKFATDKGKNCIAVKGGPGLVSQGLQIVRPEIGSRPMKE